MAVTMSLYDHTRWLFTKQGSVTLTALKVKLLDSTASFTSSHTAVTQVDGAGAKEVSGNGWPAGGVAMTTVAVNQSGANAMLQADNVDVTASGGSIGPAFAALLYDATSLKPLLYIDFGQSQSAGATTDFKIVWDAVNGIIKFA